MLFRSVKSMGELGIQFDGIFVIFSPKKFLLERFFLQFGKFANLFLLAVEALSFQNLFRFWFNLNGIFPEFLRILAKNLNQARNTLLRLEMI